MAVGAMLALGTMAADRSYLLVKFTSGEEAVIWANKDFLSIAQGFVPSENKFKLDISGTAYEFADLKELRFIDKATSIDTAPEGEDASGRLHFHLEGKKITIQGENLSGITAYSIDGRNAQATVSYNAEGVTVDFSSCTPGYYLVKTRTNSIKVCIQ